LRGRDSVAVAGGAVEEWRDDVWARGGGGTDRRVAFGLEGGADGGLLIRVKDLWYWRWLLLVLLQD
jgi:hypothetical protein